MNKEARRVRDFHICRHIANGRSIPDTAHRMGICEMTVTRVLSKRESRELVEKLATELIAETPAAVEGLKKELDLGNTVVSYLTDPTSVDISKISAFNNVGEMLSFLKLTHKQRDNILKAAGLFPSQAPGVVIQNVYNDNRKQVLSTNVLNALGQHLQLTEGDVLDVEPIKHTRLDYAESAEDEESSEEEGGDEAEI